MTDGYNGPGNAAYFDALGRQIELHFQKMRAMAKQNANMEAWERQGGDKKDLKDGMLYAKMSPTERAQDAQRNIRMWNWHGIITEEESGQLNFAKAFDRASKVEKKNDTTRFPLGSLASVSLARVDGYNGGKGGHLALADNPWPADTQEAMAWAEGFGLGMEDRPPPKAAKANGTGKRSGKSATEDMADRAAAMDSQEFGDDAAAPVE